MTAYLDVRAVSKRFGGLQALDACSFTIERNRSTCLVGPNGAGKTTIFNVITGFIRPDQGSIAFSGRPLGGLNPRQVVDAGIARTFQNLRLFDEMTALENVIVYLRGDAATSPTSALLRPFRTHAEQKRKAEAAHAFLEEVGLAHKAGEVVRNLSYGQQKLLCIARVLATGAELLLLDEPTSGLSQSALTAMVDMVERLRATGRTLLVVEHNTRVVQRIADEILFLHQGRLVSRGTPAEILADPSLAAIYFGGAD
ncbi:MAG: ABC transporter ATP-binding protein [Burkholderiales bacterium]|nr:ABC transporter ATP-binding protein [Burkholderiales bacterium]MCE7876057.1 ABC transporter ATP-binding protein [Betaproteobacteria bacterium PRO3]